MGLNAKNKEYNNSNRVVQEPMEAGTYPARLVQIIDLGVQEQNDYQGKAKPPAQEIMTTYEFVDEFIKDEDGKELEDKPRWLSERFVLYNLDSELSKSTKRYFALDPNAEFEGDWTKLVGAPVMVTITSTPGKGKNAGKVFNNIASTSSMRKREADKLPALKNEAKVFSVDDASTVDILFTLPEWIQKTVKEALDYPGSAMEKAVKTYKKDDSKEDKKEKQKNAQKEADDEAPFDVDEKKGDDNDW